MKFSSMPDGRRTFLLALAFFISPLSLRARRALFDLPALGAVFLTVVRWLKWLVADFTQFRLVCGHGVSPPFHVLDLSGRHTKKHPSLYI